jgi:RHS repeat-associated protein
MALPYDPASQVTQIRHQSPVIGQWVNQADYVNNLVGNRTSLTDRRGAQAFGYDTLDRLTSASHPLLATPQAFAYDPVGNRTTGGSVVNAGNQLTADANFAYQYDDNGNLTRKTLLATGNYTQYTYDAENRLTKVEDFAAGNPTAIATSTYRYDGLGRRIEKVANGQTKRYVYDGEGILLEYDGANVLQARYTHGPGIDEPITVTKGGSTFFYHQDGLGTVTDLTDSVGATAKSYAYDAYGTILESPGTVEQPYTYTGREFDSESGLYYYRARYYDSMTGRFLQKDPIGFSGGDRNLYSYVSNSPIKWVDPFGLFKYNAPPPKTRPVSPAMGAKVECLESCLGMKLTITGGSEPGHKSPSHEMGLAADFGFNSNPGIKQKSKEFFCCARKCELRYGITEGPGTNYPYNPPQFHISALPGGRGFGPGFGGARGEIPKDPCGC